MVKHWYCAGLNCSFHSPDNLKVLKHAERTGHLSYFTAYGQDWRIKRGELRHLIEELEKSDC